MKKLLMALLCTLVLGPALALGAQEESSHHRLHERIKRLESRLETAPTSSHGATGVAAPSHAVEKLGTVLANWSERITLSGLLEIEACYVDVDFDKARGEAGSDLVLATVELGIDAELTDSTSAHVLLLWEEDATEPIEVDEAFIVLDGIADTPTWIKAGKIYIPFGNFTSNMISDPLTLVLGETHASALEVGFKLGGIYALAYVFNGDIDAAGKDDHIDNFGAQLGYSMEREGFRLGAGISYINNLIDSDCWGDEFQDFGGYEINASIGGFGAHAVVEAGAFNFIAEYVCAVDDPEYLATSTGAVEKRDAVQVWNLEAGYMFTLMNKETLVAIAYQGTKNAESMFPQGYAAEDDELDFLPAQRYMAMVGAEIFPYTSLALEYAHDEYRNDDRADIVTMQLALKF